MDYSDKVKQDLKILGLESLEGLTLGQLSDAMVASLPSDMSRRRILNIYVMWLHFRLMAIDTSTDEFIEDIAAWYHFLKRSDKDGVDIAEAFGDWQREQTVEDPTSLRRLSIAEAELRRLIATPPMDLQSIPHSAEAEDGHGQMHPDRVRLSREAPIFIDLDDGDDDIVVLSSRILPKGRSLRQDHGREKQPDLSFLTGSNIMPVPLIKKARERSDKPLLTGANMQAVSEAAMLPLNKRKPNVARQQEKSGKSVLPLSESRAQSKKDKKVGASKLSSSNMLVSNGAPKKPSNLSLLTGSNKLAMDGTAGASPNRKFDVVRLQEKPGKPKPPPSDSPAHTRKGKEDDIRKKLPKGYRCHRCGKTGHHHRDMCPTSMDPSFDEKPCKDHICPYCKKVGDHFAYLCPRNPDPDSIGRRRQGHTTARGRTELGRPTVYRDGSRRDYSPHFYDDRPRFDGPTRGRGRSRSSVREDRGRDRLDRYIPEADFSHLSLSRETRPKRKATRSPSPYMSSQRKKSTARVKKNARARKDPKNWSTWKPAHLDDLMSGRKDEKEGRLSYDDEVDGDAPLSPPAPRTVHSPSVEMMEVDRPETSVSKTTKESAPAVKDQSLEHAARDMIRVESVKTDLLLLFNGVEHLPHLSPFLNQLFRGQESIWGKKTLQKTRPSSTDFFEILSEDEDNKSTDSEMVDETGAVEDGRQTPVCTKGEAVDSVMILAAPGRPEISKSKDEEMVDILLAVVSAMETNSVESATGSVPVEEPNEAQEDRAETVDIEILGNDGYPAEGVRQEAAPDMAEAQAEEVIVIPSSPPSHAIEPLEAEMTPLAAKSLPGCGVL